MALADLGEVPPPSGWDDEDEELDGIPDGGREGRDRVERGGGGGEAESRERERSQPRSKREREEKSEAHP